MLGFLFSDPLMFLVWTGALLAAITVHEFAHAWAADRLGDPTPRLQGRLTLNPLAHLDPMGTLMLILFRFGWGKPVVFDPYNLENPKKDSALISLAGPASNFLLAIILAIILRLTMTPFSPFALLASLIPPFIFLNIILGLFNLIPIHPLDGGKILVGLLPSKDAASADLFLRRYGVLILIMLIFPVFGGTSAVFYFLDPIIKFILQILLPSQTLV